MMKTKLFSIGLILLVVSGISCMNSCDSRAREENHAKNIIFLIGDGMGLSQVHAAMTVNGGTLALEGVTYIGLQKNNSANKYITDSAASGTALACGQKTNNGMLGVSPDTVAYESILKVAEREGKATGLVSTSAITHATPAAFIANESSRGNTEAIAADFLKTDIDLFIGGGLNHFTKREDGRDLTVDLKENGYTVLKSMDELANFSEGKVAVFTAPGHNPRATEGRGDMLPVATKKALEILDKNENGFFIMIEGSQIDWGGHENDEDFVITETLDFDKAVKEALDFAKADGETLVVITADHETGGMVVLKGDYENKTVESVFTTGGHTGIMIPVYSYGPGSNNFTGIFDNTEFKGKFEKVFGFTD